MAPAGYGSRVEGVHAVAAAAAAGRVEQLWVEERRRGRSDVEAVIASIGSDRVSIVSDVRPHAESDVPQGLVAECHPILPVSLDSLAGDQSALIVLDHVEDPHNVGAVARSALAAGITGLVVSSRRSAPLGAVAFKAAAGALERLPVAVVGSIPEALSRTKSLGVWVVGLDADGESTLFGLELFKGLKLVEFSDKKLKEVMGDIALIQALWDERTQKIIQDPLCVPEANSEPV